MNGSYSSPKYFAKNFLFAHQRPADEDRSHFSLKITSNPITTMRNVDNFCSLDERRCRVAKRRQESRNSSSTLVRETPVVAQVHTCCQVRISGSSSRCAEARSQKCIFAQKSNETKVSAEPVGSWLGVSKGTQSGAESITPPAWWD